MATGYTSMIGEGATFKEFALQCARAFGALITMRDDPFDAPIPDEIKPDTSYHERSIRQSEKELERLKKMTAEGKRKGAKVFNESQLKYYNKRRKEEAQLKEKYTKMLDQVNKWVPPTPDHQGIKDFMIQQLTESIRFDCDYYTEKEPPAPITPAKWHAIQVKAAKDNIAYHVKGRDKEIENARGRTNWIKAYKESIMALPD